MQWFMRNKIEFTSLTQNRSLKVGSPGCFCGSLGLWLTSPRAHVLLGGELTNRKNGFIAGRRQKLLLKQKK